MGLFSQSALNRRDFLKFGMLGAGAMAAPMSWSLWAGAAEPAPPGGPLLPLMQDLLKDWCDALVGLQYKDRSRPNEYGAFACPGCGAIHGRGGDAVYPLLHMAKISGQSRYLDAAIAAFAWTKNVDSPDGAWTNDLEKNSWKGITVFGSIALAEAIGRHGDLLDKSLKDQWTARLRRAADFVHRTFTMETGNINYGITATYALALTGRLLDEPRYLKRSRELAAEALKYFTPGKLIFGEGRPADRRTAKGCLPIDLGYNVEETLPSLAMYGLLEGDKPVIDAVTQSLASHLRFMLPDGAWDNSWGTRSFKWTYWGSRTSDGCQPAFALLADRHPAFAAAAYRNTLLLRACTRDGLLHGGPHYVSRGVKPCVHHTFCHAKALATVLDHRAQLPALNCEAPLPRQESQGVQQIDDIATYLAARGPWRATVTGYDWIYHNDVFHATGGAMSLLWHRDLGLLLAGSLADYELVEKHNMQPNPDAADVPLTVRVQMMETDGRFSNLYDTAATIAHREDAGAIEFTVQTRVLDRSQKPPAGGAVACELRYRFTDDAVTISAKINHPEPDSLKLALVVPVISQSSEAMKRVSEKRFEITKPGGVAVIEADSRIDLLATGRDRIFNHVPGAEAAPFVIRFNAENRAEVTCRISRGG